MISCQSIGEDSIKAHSLDHSAVYVRSKVERAFVRPDRTRILDTKASIHTNHTNIINPGNTELNVPLWFHQLLRDEGVLWVPIENGRKALHGGAKRIDKFMFVIVAALRFTNQQVGGLEAGLETNVALSTEERLVPPLFGDGHRLMDTLFSCNERSFATLGRTIWEGTREGSKSPAEPDSIGGRSLQKDQHGLARLITSF